MSEVVPEGWSHSSYGEAITLQYGKSPKDIICDDGEHPIIGTGGITGYSNDCLHNGNTVVVGRKGTINKPSFVAGRFWAIDTTYYASDYRQTDPKWFFYNLQNTDLTRYNEASGVPSLNRDTLYSIRFSLPPLPEQQKIASILTSVDEVIEKTEAQISKLQDLKKGMMQELLTKGVGHTEFKDSPVGRIPVGWEVVRFKDVFSNYKYGPRFSSKDYDESGNVRTIRGTDLSSNGEIAYPQVPTARIDLGIVESHKLNEGDLVMITTADCGSSAVFREQSIPYIASAYAIKLSPTERLFPEFIKYFMQTPKAMSQIESFIRKGTVANLAGSDVMNIVLGIPDYEEQRKISSVLIALDTKLYDIKQKIRRLISLKKALMQDLLTGKVRVKTD
jgi:type I restriction enzyme S subunit